MLYLKSKDILVAKFENNSLPSKKNQNVFNMADENSPALIAVS